MRKYDDDRFMGKPLLGGRLARRSRNKQGKGGANLCLRPKLALPCLSAKAHEALAKGAKNRCFD